MSTVHLHLLLNHVPVIGTIVALALLAYAALRKDETLVRVCLGMFAVLALAALAAFLTGEPAEEAVEGLAGVSEPVIERHEEAALLSTVALGVVGAAALGALLAFRRRRLPRLAAALFLAAALVPAGAMAWTANLGGQIRHTEIRSGAVAAADAPAGERGGGEEEDEGRER